jgi:hypothetical protein
MLVAPKCQELMTDAMRASIGIEFMCKERGASREVQAEESKQMMCKQRGARGEVQAEEVQAERSGEVLAERYKQRGVQGERCKQRGTSWSASREAVNNH